MERQAAALLKAARYPILINMHDQTANQTLVVSCEGEVENVEREGGQEKKTKVHVLFTKIWKDDVCWSVRLLSWFQADRQKTWWDEEKRHNDSNNRAKTKEKFLLADRTVKLKADVYENTLPNTHCGSVKATFKDQRLKLKKKKIRVVG